MRVGIKKQTVVFGRFNELNQLAVNLPKIKILKDAIEVLTKDHKNEYQSLLKENLAQGMDLETAIFDCYNKIVVSGKEAAHG